VTATRTGSTLVWDLGGVVLRWEPVELVREALAHRHPERDAADLARALFGGFAPGGFWADFDRGLLRLDEVADRMAAGAGLEVTEVRRVLDAVPAHLSFRSDTVALLERARAAGHRMLYLSNMPAPYADGLDPLLAPFFEDGVFSGRVGQVKPDAEIFAVAREKLGLDAGLDPALLLFLDDRADNVKAARVLGWPAAVFADAASCEAELAAAGWL
jgi:HAD superfamily hydrolase (TIGR01509 family)